MDELVARVRELHARLDDSVRQWSRGYEQKGGRIYCGKGCRNCCRLAVHATFPEALTIAEILTPPQVKILCGYVEALRPHLSQVADMKSYLRTHSREAGFCPFLDTEGACGIYPVRPFSCRSLLSTRNPDYCGIDLSALHPLEKEAFLSSLDPSIVAFPTHYAAAPQGLGRSLENATSGHMAQLSGFTLSGNVTLLVWLILERGLIEAADQGAAAIADLLVREKLSLPFLLELESAS
jgi:Fe-S-cluster containining protein